jgi:ribonuclease HI
VPDNIAVDRFMAEALGICWAIQFVRDQGLQSVSIFSDAANVVDCIASKVKLAAIEMVFHDCRELLSCLPNVSVLFVSRDQNVDAHNLAATNDSVVSNYTVNPS